MSVLPKSAVARVRPRWRRRARRTAGDGALGFALRLLAGFLLTLGLVEVVGLAIIDRTTRSNQVAQYAAIQRSDVRIFEGLGRDSLTTDAAIREIGELLKVLGQRPGTINAELFDSSGTIIASDDGLAIGFRDADPRIPSVILTDRAYAGHEGDPKSTGATSSSSRRSTCRRADTRTRSRTTTRPLTARSRPFTVRFSSWAAAGSSPVRSCSTSSAAAPSSAATAPRSPERPATE